jgi:hypothetical protein
MFGWLLPKGDAWCGEAGQNKCRAGAKTARSQGRAGAKWVEAACEVCEAHAPMTMPTSPLWVCGSNTKPKEKWPHGQLHLDDGATRKRGQPKETWLQCAGGHSYAAVRTVAEKVLGGAGGVHSVQTAGAAT